MLSERKRKCTEERQDLETDVDSTRAAWKTGFGFQSFKGRGLRWTGSEKKGE